MKLFEFHDGILTRQNNRPYYNGTWEPLRMEMFRALPFQYEKSGTDIFTMYQVQNGTETNITSYFDGDNLISGWTYPTELLTEWTNGGGITPTFTASGKDIISAIDDGSGYHWARTNAVTLSSGDKVRLDYNLILYLLQVPAANLYNDTLGHSNPITLVSGENTLDINITESGTYYLYVYADNVAENFAFLPSLKKIYTTTIGSFVPAASDYLQSNDFDLVDGDKIHFSISGTFPSGNIDYNLYYGSDYVTGETGKQLEFTHTVGDTGTYHFKIKDRGTADGDITSGITKLAVTTLDIHNDFVTYNGEELFTPLARGISYFKISDGNGLFSDDVDVDSVNFLLDSWPSSISFYNGVLDSSVPATFVTSGKDVTSFDAKAAGGAPYYQSPLSNLMYVKKGDILYMSFRDTLQGAVTWESDATLPVMYFKYASGVTITGTGISRAASDGSHAGNIMTCKVVATADGYGRIYGTLTTGGTTRNFMNCDVYKSYSDKCIKISISSSTTDLTGIYYKGGFTQVLWKEANVRKSPVTKVEIIGEERNGVLVKEKITSAVKYSCKIKVTESEYEGLVYSLGCTWTITDQTGKVFTCNNLEIGDPEWHNGNGICELTFDDNISVFSLNNTAL